MGTIDLSKSARMSGRIGPVVAYVTKGGKQVFRAYVKPRNPQTPKQMAHRAKFALVNRGLSPLRIAIQRGHPGEANPYRRLVGKAYHEAVAGTYPHFYLDYGKVQIAGGPLPLPSGVRLHFDVLSRTATFTWDTHSGYLSLPASHKDKVYIVCFDTALPAEVQTLARGTRSAGRASVTLPEDWEPATTHFWIYLASPDLQKTSGSCYLKPE